MLRKTLLVLAIATALAACSKDAKEPAKAWLAWMLDGQLPVKHMGACTTPIERNTAFAQKYRINGTPAIIFADGTRVPGAMSAEQLEKQLVASAAAKPGSN